MFVFSYYECFANRQKNGCHFPCRETPIVVHCIEQKSKCGKDSRMRLSISKLLHIFNMGTKKAHQIMSI
nr:MAG TPA: hypothetical protein [Caudoviricetes sp.]